jgi:hypothetical protein
MLAWHPRTLRGTLTEPGQLEYRDSKWDHERRNLLSQGPGKCSYATASERSPLPPPFMSHTQPTVSSSSNFQLIINNALDKYKRRTKNDLLAHPLAAQLQTCNSPGDILAVLQQQVQGLDRSRSSDERWSRWLDPTVNVLYTLSSTLAAGVGLVCLKSGIFL